MRRGRALGRTPARRLSFARRPRGCQECERAQAAAQDPQEAEEYGRGRQAGEGEEPREVQN